NMDGMEMIQKIRNKHPFVKIIITSTVNEMQTVLDTVEIGIAKYIIKPIILTELEESLLKCADEIQQLNPQTASLPPEERKQIEARIKKELSSIIKKAAGKGPRDIAVFIHDDSIDAIIYDAFTTYEHTLLQKRDNYSMVEQCRRSFYNILLKEINEAVSNIWQSSVNMEPAEVNTHKLTDKLCFKIQIK
ncbi:MAG: Na-translocating system protein MpsC family protein, partial [Lentihominibacter sp.]